MMQVTPDHGQSLGRCLCDDKDARLVITDVEGADEVQAVMEKCASYEPSERPEVAKVVHDLCDVKARFPSKVGTKSAAGSDSFDDIMEQRNPLELLKSLTGRKRLTLRKGSSTARGGTIACGGHERHARCRCLH